MTTPRTARVSTMLGTNGLRIGDSVTLPEGQKAILRFVGKIQGKPGEYAGVELIGDFESQGRHSGSYNGISYFITSKPNTGLFITYSKLIGSTLRNTTSGSSSSGLSSSASSLGSPPRTIVPPTPGTIGRSRLSVGPGTITHSSQQQPQLPYQHRSQQQQQQQQLSPSRKTSSIARRQSLVPTTPRRGPPSGSGPRGGPGPGPGAPPLFMSPPQARRTTMTSSNPISTITRSSTIKSPDTRQRLLVSHNNNIDSVLDESRVAILNKELEEARQTIAEKESLLEEQSRLLHDVEESLSEFQILAKSHDEEQDAAAGPYDIDTLMKTIEDRDRKLNNLRSEFELKRQEFRITIDSLQADMQETSEAYESEIRNLKDSMGQAEVIHNRIIELEHMVTSLEKGLESSQMSEQNARQQLSNLADIENKLLEKEQELKEASESVEHYSTILKSVNSDNSPKDGGPGNDNSSHALQQLQKALEDEQFARRAIEKELAEFRTRENIQADQLRKEIDEYRIKYELSSKELSHSSEILSEQHVKYEALTKELEELRIRNESSKEIQVLKERIDELENELAESKVAINTALANNTNSNDEQEQHLKSIQLLYDQEKLSREKLEHEIERLETALEAKVFREDDLVKEIEALKIRSSPSSIRSGGSSAPTTPPQRMTTRTSQILRSPRGVNSVHHSGDEADFLHHEVVGVDPNDSIIPGDDDIELVGGYEERENDDNDHTKDLPVYKSPKKVDPAAGRTLWCGLCEREGHESLDCPYEEEF